jgi:hypothetical protein
MPGTGGFQLKLNLIFFPQRGFRKRKWLLTFKESDWLSFNLLIKRTKACAAYFKVRPKTLLKWANNYGFKSYPKFFICKGCKDTKPDSENVRRYRKGGRVERYGRCQNCLAEYFRLSSKKNYIRVMGNPITASKKRGRELKYQKNRRKTDISFKIAGNLRNRFKFALKEHLRGKRVSPVKDLGCSMAFFIKHLEAKWLPGMSWDNYGLGNNRWNLDHIKELCKFDLTKKSERKKAVHYTNLQPLWHVDNIKKNGRSSGI